MVEIEEVISPVRDVDPAEKTVFAPSEILLLQFFKGAKARSQRPGAVSESLRRDFDGGSVHFRLKESLGDEVKGDRRSHHDASDNPAEGRRAKDEEGGDLRGFHRDAQKSVVLLDVAQFAGDEESCLVIGIVPEIGRQIVLRRFLRKGAFADAEKVLVRNE